jgi:predicted metal-binding protein
MTKHALYVCKSCSFSLTQRDYLGERGGKCLFDRVSDLSESWFLKADFAVEELVCLSACKRPCAIALTAANKTSLMFGDLSPLDSAAAILQLCEQYHTSIDGIIPRNERPEILQKSILARIPPSPS